MFWRTMLALESLVVSEDDSTMFDSSFDRGKGGIPRSDRRLLWILRIAAAGALTAMAGSANAQLPSAPLLQNVWTMPGMAAAFNAGGGGGGTVYAAAGSWTPASGRFQISGGVGSQTVSGVGTSWAYGARAAMPLGNPQANFGFAAFAGIGGASAVNRSADTARTDTTATLASRIPVGLSVGWRHAIGSRGFSVYASPAYVWVTGNGQSKGLLRTGIGADVGITSSIGITGGVELGQNSAIPGAPAGTVYGLGVSYAFGRR
jgi:hypothetical protein